MERLGENQDTPAWVMSRIVSGMKTRSWENGSLVPVGNFFIRVWIILGTLGFDLGAVGFAEGHYVASQGDTEEVVGL